MKHILTEQQIIWPESIPTCFDQIYGQKKNILAAFSSSNRDPNRLLNVFRTWFVFRNKVSIIECLFLDTGDGSCLIRTVIYGRSRSCNTATEQREKSGVNLPDQSLGFSNSKHPITFGQVPFIWGKLSACITAVLFKKRQIEPLIATVAG